MIRFFITAVFRFFCGFKLYSGPNLESLFFEWYDIFFRKIFFFEAQREKPVIFDVGGNIGLQDIYFKMTYPHAKIFCFEPDHFLASIIKKNMDSNGFKDVVVIEAACGNREGYVEFSVDRSGGGSGSLIISNNSSRKEKVKMVRLSKYINRKVDLLKLNIEGAEWVVLKEIRNKLHLVDKLILEYHCFSSLPKTLDKILWLLGKSGFEYVCTDAVKLPFGKSVSWGGQKYRHFNLIYAWKVNK